MSNQLRALRAGLLSIFLMFCSLPGCTPHEELADRRDQGGAADDSVQALAWREIDYVGDGITGHRMDIYRPRTGSGPFPVVVYIYGSAWMRNDGKASVNRHIAPALLRAGFAVVAINHRASNEAIFPAQIQDAKAAIRFVRANAETYDLDPYHIGATGNSSGGHLVALLGTTGGVTTHTVGGVTMDIEGELGNHTEASSRVQAVCDWFGPTNFLIMNRCDGQVDHDGPGSPESLLIGRPIQENPELSALANPITYVDKNDPPFKIFHGDADPAVPYCQSDLLDRALDAAGVSSDFLLVEGAGHGPGLLERQHVGAMVQFFITTLKNP